MKLDNKKNLTHYCGIELNVLEEKNRESPLGKPHPTRYNLDDERPGKTVKFEIHSNDERTMIESELNDLKLENEQLRGLILKAVPSSWVKSSMENWGPDCEWEEEVVETLNDFSKRTLERVANASQSVRKVTGYFTVGLYSDGYPGELFIYAGKQGEETHGWVHVLGKAISMLLQHGIDPKKIYHEFKMDSFSPMGITNVKQAPICKSIIDMIMKYMEDSFIPTAESTQSEDDNYFVMIDSVTDQKE